jgi:hypothetical protein
MNNYIQGVLILFERVDRGEVPIIFIATIVKVKVVPLLNPVNSAEVNEPDTSNGKPELQVIVYRIITEPPLYGGVQVIAAALLPDNSANTFVGASGTDAGVLILFEAVDRTEVPILFIATIVKVKVVALLNPVNSAEVNEPNTFSVKPELQVII